MYRLIVHFPTIKLVSLWQYLNSMSFTVANSCLMSYLYKIDGLSPKILWQSCLRTTCALLPYSDARYRVAPYCATL